MSAFGWGRGYRREVGPIRSANAQLEARILVIHEDGEVADRILSSVGSEGSLPAWRDAVARRAVHADDGLCVRWIDSLSPICSEPLEAIDVVLCAASLPDGGAADVLAYCRGVRPDAPVIVLAEADELDLAAELIRAGAIDFVPMSEASLTAIPIIIAKGLELHRMQRENERLQRNLSRSLAEQSVRNGQLQEMIDRLEWMARTDELTGLSNRRWLNLMLCREWAEATRNNLPLALLMIDLDELKAINDQYGHSRGDQVLNLTGRIIRANCREIDIAARYGGDEFVVVLPHTDSSMAMEVAGRILAAYEEAAGAQDELSSLGMSIGVAHVDLSRPVSPEQLIAHADEAMYAAKAAGKCRVVLRDNLKPRVARLAS